MVSCMHRHIVSACMGALRDRNRGSRIASREENERGKILNEEFTF